MTIPSKLYGLVLAGGHSKRMGQDKSAIAYHGKSQATFVYDMLASKLERVYISCRPSQLTCPHIRDYPTIADRHTDLGPTGGILSAFGRHPKVAWLVVACDMPFLNLQTIADLIHARDPSGMATCFFNAEKNWPEPLCTIYEPMAAERLERYVAMGKSCPRKVLMNSEIATLEPSYPKVLDNINTPEEMNSIGAMI